MMYSRASLRRYCTPLIRRKSFWLGRGARATLKFFNCRQSKELPLDQNSAADLEVRRLSQRRGCLTCLCLSASAGGDRQSEIGHPSLKVVKSSRYLLYKRPENLSGEKGIQNWRELSKLNTPLLSTISWETSFPTSLWSLRHADKQLLLVMDWIHRATAAGSSPW